MFIFCKTAFATKPKRCMEIFPGTALIPPSTMWESASSRAATLSSSQCVHPYSASTIISMGELAGVGGLRGLRGMAALQHLSLNKLDLTPSSAKF